MSAKSIVFVPHALACAAMLAFLMPASAKAQTAPPPWGKWQGRDPDGTIVNLVLSRDRFLLYAGKYAYAGTVVGWEPIKDGGVLTIRFPESTPPNDRNRYYVAYRSGNGIVFGNQSFRVEMRAVP